MRKIVTGCLLASSVILANPYIPNYPDLLLTKEQAVKNFPPIVAYTLDDAIKSINEFLQANNTNLTFTTDDMQYKKIKQFNFRGGSLEQLINYLNNKNIFVEKFNDIVFLKNFGDVRYQVGEYHTKEELKTLKDEIATASKAVEVREKRIDGKDYFVVKTSPYGQKAAKSIVEKDVKKQLSKSKRLNIEYTKGDKQVLTTGIRLVKPMTVQRFFRVLGEQNLKTYIVKGNANILMNENIVIKNTHELSKYLKSTTGHSLNLKQDGKLYIVEVK